MLRDNQRPAQRDHHQNSQQPAEERDEHHAADLEIEPEDHDCGHRHAQAERDGFARGAGGLNDVVFKDRGVASTELGPKPE